MSEQALVRGEAHAEARPTRIMIRCTVVSPPLEKYDFPFLENIYFESHSQRR